MSDARKEIEDKLRKAEEQREATLKLKEEAEKAVSEAQEMLRGRLEALQALGQDEGAQRLNIGELKKMLDAFDATPEAGGHD